MNPALSVVIVVLIIFGLLLIIVFAAIGYAHERLDQLERKNPAPPTGFRNQ